MNTRKLDVRLLVLVQPASTAGHLFAGSSPVSHGDLLPNLCAERLDRRVRFRQSVRRFPALAGPYAGSAAGQTDFLAAYPDLVLICLTNFASRSKTWQ
jgi:hypothetical protein